METPQEASITGRDVTEFSMAKFSKRETVVSGIVAMAGVIAAAFLFWLGVIAIIFWQLMRDYQF